MQGETLFAQMCSGGEVGAIPYDATLGLCVLGSALPYLWGYGLGPHNTKQDYL